MSEIGRYKDNQMGVANIVRSVVMEVVDEMDGEIKHENRNREGDDIIIYDYLQDGELEDNTFVNLSMPNRQRYWASINEVMIESDDEMLNKIDLDNFEYMKFLVVVHLGRNDHVEGFLYNILLKRLEQRLKNHNKIFGFKALSKGVDDISLQETGTSLDVKIANLVFLAHV